MAPDVYLLVSALAFMGCVLAIPVVTRVAHWAGAIDRPDQFRRIHKGATPRMGGLGLAFGLFLGLLPTCIEGAIPGGSSLEPLAAQKAYLALAVLIVLAVGVIDDSRGVSPKAKILGQSLAVVVLYFGGLRIEHVEILGHDLTFGHLFQWDSPIGHLAFDPSAFGLTLLWFLGCMNVWNLIDGMDGLASGVGLVVTVTLMLVALALGNYGAALLAAALAGGLAGFLLYNWHPACIFLGDSGSLLIGLLLGIIGIQGARKPAGAISLLIPLMAMGLPISDTALAIFRRWARNLPLTAADRSHVHHLLIGLGLNPRQAATMLYIFAAFLCGMVLLGVAAGSDVLAVGLGLWGASVFLFLLYSRRDDLANLRADLATRSLRRKQERAAAKATWEAIQRLDLCSDPAAALRIAAEAIGPIGCESLRLAWEGPGGLSVRHEEGTAARERPGSLSSAIASFRLVGREGTILRMEVRHQPGSPTPPDICFRFAERLGLAASERLRGLHGLGTGRLPEQVRAEPAAALALPTPVFAAPAGLRRRVASLRLPPLLPWHAGPGQD